MRDFAWVNPEGRRDLNPRDIDGAVAILWRTWGLGLALCAILAIAL
jgi:adenosylcobinamide-phosphate synthase